MENSCVPIEVCERIIDLTRLTDNGGSGVEVDYHTLCSCSLVCRAWLPRSRCNMFFRVVLHTSTQQERLLSLSSHYPVRELELGPLDVPDSYRVDLDVAGPAIAPLIRANIINEIYYLACWNMVWLYPRIYLSLLSELESLKILDLHSMYFPTAGDLIGLLRCFPRLEDLTCGGLGLQYPYTIHHKAHHRIKTQRLHRVEVRVMSMQLIKRLTYSSCIGGWMRECGTLHPPECCWQCGMAARPVITDKLLQLAAS